MFRKKIGLPAILILSVLCFCIGNVSAETYNYAGSDGDWQGQLTLTVTDDGSVLVNGASVVGGTIENEVPNAPNEGTYSELNGDFTYQNLVLSGTQGYAGTGAVDANGNSAGAEVSFTNGNNVYVDQVATIGDVPSVTPLVSSGRYGDLPIGFAHVYASQDVEVGRFKVQEQDALTGSSFETIRASTSAIGADGSSAGVIAQATSTDPMNRASFSVDQDASILRISESGFGSFSAEPFLSYTQASQGGMMRDVSTATIHEYAINPVLSTSGSLNVVEGDLLFKDMAMTLQENFDGNPYSIALVRTSGLVQGQSGSSNVVSTYANGDSASVSTSFLMDESPAGGYATAIPDLNYNIIGLGVSENPLSLVWARTNIEGRETGFGIPTPSGGYNVAVSAQNSLGKSAGNSFIDPSSDVGAGAGIIRGNTRSFNWARYWPSGTPI